MKGKFAPSKKLPAHSEADNYFWHAVIPFHAFCNFQIISVGGPIQRTCLKHLSGNKKSSGKPFRGSAFLESHFMLFKSALAQTMKSSCLAKYEARVGSKEAALWMLCIAHCWNCSLRAWLIHALNIPLWDIDSCTADNGIWETVKKETGISVACSPMV